jgi:hypothetical protein
MPIQNLRWTPWQSKGPRITVAPMRLSRSRRHHRDAGCPGSDTQDAVSLPPECRSPVLPVFIWEAPGIGKSALVRGFAEAVGLPCISLLGSQLVPEDIIGVQQVRWPLALLSASHNRPRRALLPVSRRVARLLAKGVEGVLLADPRPPHRRVHLASRHHRHWLDRWSGLARSCCRIDARGTAFRPLVLFISCA